jgi:parallel beta-helix repeat protein
MPSRISLAYVLALIALAIGFAGRIAAQETRPPGCTVTVPTGESITAAIYAATPGGVVCLAPGAHRPFEVDERAPAGITVRGAIPATAAVVAESADAVQVLGAVRFTIADLAIRGGNPTGLYARGAAELTLRNVRVESSTYGVHLDDGTQARLEGVTITRPARVGLLMRRRAEAIAVRLRVPESDGAGIAALGGAGPLTLRESEVGSTAGPALFVGAPACGDLGSATLDVPQCILDDPDASVSDNRVTIDGFDVHDGPGPGLVFYAGVRAGVRNARVVGRQLTGLFAWGAQVDVTESEFSGNGELAIEYRAYPDPREGQRREAAGSVVGSVVSGTLPLGGPLLGDGIVARGAQLSVRGNTVSGNAGNGIAFLDGTLGEIIGNTVTGNGAAGICTGPTVAMIEADNELAGNRTDAVDLCSTGAEPLNDAVAR